MIAPLARLVSAALAAVLVPAAAFAAAAAPSTPSAPAIPAGRKIMLVTGSTDGLGREVALRLAGTGAHVIVHGRNRERGEAVVKEIETAGTGSARFYAADLASLAQVRELGAAIARDYPRLDVLVNNAGIWLNSGDKRQLSADGHEMHFAVNYLAGFALTRQLLPLLRAAAPSRIVNVASGAQTPLDFDNLMLERGYTDSRGYGTSKLAQILFTFDLARELAGTGVSAYTLHPSTFMDTNMVTSRGSTPRSSVADGAAAVLRLVTAPNLESGQYFNVQTPARANAQAYDEAARARLKKISEELVAAAPAAPPKK